MAWQGRKRMRRMSKRMTLQRPWPLTLLIFFSSNSQVLWIDVSTMKHALQVELEHVKWFTSCVRGCLKVQGLWNNRSRRRNSSWPVVESYQESGGNDVTNQNSLVLQCSCNQWEHSHFNKKAQFISEGKQKNQGPEFTANQKPDRQICHSSVALPSCFCSHFMPQELATYCSMLTLAFFFFRDYGSYRILQLQYT